ncbi:hypothetical protein [Brevundimonas sp.]|uniref:hypothetical protein n=1 Tax=Brevundimonas sp. TaxID=1871086 RepID=UPI00351CF99E
MINTGSSKASNTRSKSCAVIGSADRSIGAPNVSGRGATEGDCTFKIQAEAATTTAPPTNQFAISGWMNASPTITTKAITMLMPTVQKREVEIGATGEGEDS